MTVSYRDNFRTEQDAWRYDMTQYNDNSYWTLIWQIEKRILKRIMAEMRAHHDHIDYLDVACGTGRVLSFVEPNVESATGIDISQLMLDRAKERVRAASLICGDILEGSLLSRRFDLITSFRFVLNAEPQLRREVLHKVAGHLEGRDSRLVFNNHGNLMSHKLILWPYHRILQAGWGYNPRCNYLRHGQILELLAAAGLEVVEVVGCGHWSAKALHGLSFDALLKAENMLAGRPWIGRLGVNQIYVTRLKDKSDVREGRGLSPAS